MMQVIIQFADTLLSYFGAKGGGIKHKIILTYFQQI